MVVFPLRKMYIAYVGLYATRFVLLITNLGKPVRKERLPENNSRETIYLAFIFFFGLECRLLHPFTV